MKTVKTRKPRITSKDLGFDGSHMFGQPYTRDTPATKKLYDRLVSGVCLGCGQTECRCRSKQISNA